MMAPIQISHTGYWVYSMPHAGFLSILDGQAGYRAGGDASLPAFSIKVALGGYEVMRNALLALLPCRPSASRPPPLKAAQKAGRLTPVCNL